MLHAAQLRAARALLGWRQEDLAREAKVGIATLQRIESAQGPVTGNVATIWRLQTTLERAGICFITAQAGQPAIGVSKIVLER